MTQRLAFETMVWMPGRPVLLLTAGLESDREALRVMVLGAVNAHRGGPRIGPLSSFSSPPAFCAVAAPSDRAVARGSTFTMATSTVSRKGEREISERTNTFSFCAGPGCHTRTRRPRVNLAGASHSPGTFSPHHLSLFTPSQILQAPPCRHHHHRCLWRSPEPGTQVHNGPPHIVNLCP